jgi:hypothetical protein
MRCLLMTANPSTKRRELFYELVNIHSYSDGRRD